MDIADRIQDQARQLEEWWEQDARWNGVVRPYTAEEVVRLRGSVVPECTLAQLGAARLWRLLAEEGHVHALGALTGGQAVQMVKAGLKAIYLSGWQVAADANLAAATYPDQSLYPANSVPQVVRRPALRERAAGPWEGRTRDEIERGWPGDLESGRRPEGFETDSEYLQHLTMEGARKRWGSDLNDKIVERLHYELGVIDSMGFSSYFLIVWDLIKHARDNGIRVGPRLLSPMFVSGMTPSRAEIPGVARPLTLRLREPGSEKKASTGAGRAGREHVARHGLGQPLEFGRFLHGAELLHGARRVGEGHFVPWR